ncbi:MAG: acetyl-CoA carboxylase biotin carboxyl carrier protein [Planctomycetia bacterium]|nr:acetyl-CoA carboxylase biotin carboxyl carrier protein [Planctomycetia bacterium]
MGSNQPSGKSTSGSRSEVFDVPKVRDFVQLMKDFDLSEMELRQGEMHILLKRGTAFAVPEGVVSPAVAPVPTLAATAPSVSEVPAPAAPQEVGVECITSPIVGTFYSKPNPNSPAFVNVGDRVAEGKTVCIVEAMKVMNQIPATLSGKVVAVLVQDGDAVEFGQPLFKVDTKG